MVNVLRYDGIPNSGIRPNSFKLWFRMESIKHFASLLGKREGRGGAVYSVCAHP